MLNCSAVKHVQLLISKVMSGMSKYSSHVSAQDLLASLQDLANFHYNLHQTCQQSAKDVKELCYVAHVIMPNLAAKRQLCSSEASSQYIREITDGEGSDTCWEIQSETFFNLRGDAGTNCSSKHYHYEPAASVGSGTIDQNCQSA